MRVTSSGRCLHSAGMCMNVARNANILSYIFLTLVVIWALLAIWPHGLH
jgi:hypothetical protein